jgi:hypothetical protein
MAISHVKSVTIADGTNTNIVRPSDWNSHHNQYYTLGGNTAGASTVSGTNVVLHGGNNVTLSGTGDTILVSAGGVAVSAFGGGQNSGTIQFVNSNGVSFGYSAGSITATVIPGAAAGIGAIQAGGSTITSGTFSLGNANGMSFVGSNGSVVGSYTVPGATQFANSNNVTFGLAGSTITASASFPAQTVQPVAYAAGGTTNNFSTLAFVNTNGVSWSTSTDGIRASVDTNYQSQGAYLTTAAQSGHSHGNPTLALTNLTGTTASNSAGLTLSLSAAAQSAQPVAYAVGGTTNNFSTINFVNTNGVSWSTSTDGVRASVATNYQSQGAYLTTARASNDAVGLNVAITNGTWTVNSSGVSLNLSNHLTTQTVQPVAYAAGGTTNAFSTINFVNTNGVSWSTSTDGVRASVATNYQSAGAYLTTAAQVSHSHGNPTLALTNLTGTTASNSAGFTLSLSANAPGAGAFSAGNSTDGVGTTGLVGGQLVFFEGANITLSQSINGASASLSIIGGAGGAGGVNVAGGGVTQGTGTVNFANSNNVTFGLSNNGTITASASFAQSTQPVAYAVGGTTNNFSTINFVNTNGVSWSTSTDGIRATVATNYQSQGAYLTTARASNDGVGLNSAITNGAMTLNSSGLSLNLSNHLTTQTVQPVAYAVGGTTNNFSTIAFVNTNGVSWSTSTDGVRASVATNYQSAGAYLTTARASNDAVGLNAAITNGTWTVNSSGISLNLSNHLTTQSVQPVAYAVGGTTNVFSTIAFVNTNGVSWSTSTDGVRASVATNYQSQGAYLTTARASNDAVGLNAAITNGAWTVNSSGISLNLSNHLTTQSVQPVAYAVGGTTNAFSTINFVNTNGVSWSTSTDGVRATVKTDYQSSNANYLTIQSAQPVAASASNGSFNFSTLKFVEGSGVTWATQANGIQASVKTDYQSSNANYLTSQSVAPAGIAIPGTTITNGTVQFVNSNGVTFGFGAGASASQITITVQPGAAAGVAAFAASNSTQTSGTVQFANSNGVSWSSGTQGIFATVKTDYQSSNANYLTVQSAQPVAYAAGGTTNAFSTINFVNTNGVSWSTSTDGVRASVATNYQSQGAYLTTARASNDGIGLNTAITNGTWTVNSSGISLNLSNHLTTQSVQPVAYAVGGTTNAFSTINFVNTNGVSWSTSTDGVRATVATNYQSQGAYLTTARASNDAVGLNAAITNGLWTVNSSGISLNLSNHLTSQTVQPAVGAIAVAGSTATSGTIVFANSNGLTFSSGTQGIFGSYTVPVTVAQSVQPVAYAVGGTTNNFSTLAFVNTNGVSWSTSTDGVRATVKTDYQSSNANYLTSQSNQAFSGSNGSSTFQTVTFGSSNGLHFYLTNGSVVGSYTVPAGGGGGVAISAGSNGGTAAASQSTGTVVFSNSNGVTFGLSNNGVMTASVAAGAAAGIAAIAVPGTTQTSGTLVLANSNGITWSSGTQGVFGTVQTDYAVSSHSHGNPTLALTNLTGTTASNSAGFTLSLSAGAGGGGGALTISANNGSYASGVLNFPATLGHTWSTDTNGVYLASDADPWGYTALTYQNRQLGASSAWAPTTANQMWLLPMRMGAPVSGSTLMQIMSFTGSVTSNQTNTVGATMDLALYKVTQTTAPTRFDSIWSTRALFTWFNGGTTTMSFAYGHGGTTYTTGGGASSASFMSSVFGLRFLTYTLNSVFDTGLYAYGLRISTSSAGGSSVMRSFCPIFDAPIFTVGNLGFGGLNNTAASSIGFVDAGILTATTASPVASFAFTDVRQSNNLVPYVKIGAV